VATTKQHREGEGEGEGLQPKENIFYWILDSGDGTDRLSRNVDKELPPLGA
jgi:hypothetical protein